MAIGEPLECPGCGTTNPPTLLGQLGNLIHLRCRDCGMGFSVKSEDRPDVLEAMMAEAIEEQEEDDEEEDENSVGTDQNGDSVGLHSAGNPACPAVHGGICTIKGHNEALEEEDEGDQDFDHEAAADGNKKFDHERAADGLNPLVDADDEE